MPKLHEVLFCLSYSASRDNEAGVLALVQELQATEPSCLYPERYRRIRRKLLELPEL